NPGPDAVAKREELVEHRPPIHGRILDEAVASGDIVAYVLFEPARIGQIAHPDAASRDLVFVSWPDAPRGRPDPALAGSCFRKELQVAMIGQNQMRFVADDDAAVDTAAVARHLAAPHERSRRIDPHAVANDANDTGMKNAGRNQPKNKFRSRHEHR